MSKRDFRANDGSLAFYGDKADLQKELERLKQLLQNYLDIEDDLDDPAYIARGNGFCDAKYSEDFIQGQIEKIEHQINLFTQWIESCNE